MLHLIQFANTIGSRILQWHYLRRPCESGGAVSNAIAKNFRFPPTTHFTSIMYERNFQNSFVFLIMYEEVTVK